MASDNCDIDIALVSARELCEVLETLYGVVGRNEAIHPAHAGACVLGQRERRDLLMDARRAARAVDTALRPRRAPVRSGKAYNIQVWHRGQGDPQGA